MNALDERVLGDDQPPAELGRVVLRPDDQPALLQLSGAGRARRLQTASSTAARSASISATARITATPAAPARMHSPALAASTPPIATTGIDTERQMSRSPSSPIGVPASGFDGVCQIGPAPRYVAPENSATAASRRLATEIPA